MNSSVREYTSRALNSMESIARDLAFLKEVNHHWPAS